MDSKDLHTKALLDTEKSPHPERPQPTSTTPTAPSPPGLLSILDRLAVAVEELITEVRAYRTEQATMKMAQMEDPFQRMNRE